MFIPLDTYTEVWLNIQTTKCTNKKKGRNFHSKAGVGVISDMA